MVQSSTTRQAYLIAAHETIPGWWWFTRPSSVTELRTILTTEELEQLHLLTGKILGCSDENCPCYEAGRQRGLEAPPEPQRSRV